MKHDYNDIVIQHSSDTLLNNLEKMTIETHPELPPIVSKSYVLPMKHHKFMKEEIDNLLEAVLIVRSMSPYTESVIVTTRKSKPGALLAETNW